MLAPAAVPFCRLCIFCSPICRVQSFFVVPAPSWPRDAAEKDAIMSSYKSALAGRRCRLFADGEGTCPFGTSCFYAHVLPDGRDAKLEAAPRLRHQLAADGEHRIMPQVRLSTFLAGWEARR